MHTIPTHKSNAQSGQLSQELADDIKGKLFTPVGYIKAVFAYGSVALWLAFIVTYVTCKIMGICKQKDKVTDVNGAIRQLIRSTDDLLILMPKYSLALSSLNR